MTEEKKTDEESQVAVTAPKDEEQLVTPEESPKGQEEASGDSEKVAEEVLPTPVDEETANRLGIKESAANSDLMLMEKAESESTEDEEDEEPALPSFFIDTEKRHRVEMDILCSKKDGQVLSVSRTGLDIEYDDFKYLNHVKEWFEFTLPAYDDMSSYRQRCGVYRQEAQQVLIDRLQLRNFLLVWHLKDWSLRDADGKKVELEHSENGTLSEKSLSMVYKTHTSILDVLLTIFEKDLLLT